MSSLAQPRGEGAMTTSALAIAAVACAGIALLQPRLAHVAHEVKQREDVYVLPPPAQLKVMTLGYRSAVADMLWAKLLVEFGVHWGEKRPFNDVPKYVDAILELEPDHKLVYRYVDTLLVYRPPQGTKEDAIKARDYLARGTRERPYDHEVWLEYGQFQAFIAPSFLDTWEERDRWRHDGALAMSRAVELGADADAQLSAATILSKTGETQAAIKHLQRAYAVTDDPVAREDLLGKLTVLKATDERDMAEKDMRAVESAWSRTFPFVSRGEFLLLAPVVDAAECAGTRAAWRPLVDSPKCATEWQPHLPSGRTTR